MFAGSDLCGTAAVNMFAGWDLYENVLLYNISQRQNKVGSQIIEMNRDLG